MGHKLKLELSHHFCIQAPLYHPQSNSQAEHFVDTFKHILLKKVGGNNNRGDCMLSYFLTNQHQMEQWGTHELKALYYTGVQVGSQLWAWPKNQVCPRYTKNDIVRNRPTIPFDLLMDTFELSSPSPPHIQKNQNENERSHRYKQKCNHTRVRHIQVDPKCAQYD